MISNSFSNLSEYIKKEKEIAKKIQFLFERKSRAVSDQDKSQISAQINSLSKLLNQINKDIPEIVDSISLPKVVHYEKIPTPKKPLRRILPSISSPTILQKEKEKLEIDPDILRRIKQKEKTRPSQKEKSPNSFVKLSNRFFSPTSQKVLHELFFQSLKRDLIKSNLMMLPVSYISVIFFTTLVSFLSGIILFTFLMIFQVSLSLPFLSVYSGEFLTRLLTLFWIVPLIPLITFFSLYFYPSLEKKSVANRIERELPFAVIHMSAISGAMVEPSRIFEILISTGEYKFLEKEFKKLINQINVYGYDLVTALKISASNTASPKLNELFNGLATTISSGGDLQGFFEKRSQTLLFDYRLEREKQTKSAETFMDIYISVVIAAPMMLMLLLMTIQISGLGISLGPTMLTLVMILGVVGINILFLTFLHLKQPQS